MNILFVSHGLYPCDIGGAEVFNYYLIRELTKSHKIFLVTCCKEKINLDATAIRLRRRKFGPGRISIPLQDLIAILRLRKKIDIIHISYMGAERLRWIPYLITNRLLGIPYVITIHGGGMYMWKKHFPQKYLFRDASAVIAVSGRIKEEYEKRTGRNVRYIPPLIPFNYCRDDREQLRNRYGFGVNDTIILSLGSINEIKGSKTLLNAFINSGREFIEKSKLRLLFVGDGDLKKELESIARENKLDTYIKFTGCIARAEVPSMFKMADIYIIPSLFEGTSISLLEAMFNGMPVIGSNANGIKDIIEHGKNGLLFEVGNHNDLKDRIIYLIDNKEAARRMSLEAKKSFDSKYDYQKVVQKYIEIYEKSGRT